MKKPKRRAQRETLCFSLFFIGMLMLDFLITKLELTLNENANFQARDETKGKRARRRISAPVLHTQNASL
jgi:hypothetical protein